MFEVEKKVILTKSQLQELKLKGSLLEKQEIKDTYFDDHLCTLTCHDKWLRKRSDYFELKIGLRKSATINYYEEVTDEEKIKKALKIQSFLPLKELLLKLEIFPFCSFTTYREKYQLDEFIVDLDVADFGDFTYSIAEFELVVSDKNEMNKAEEKIEKKLKELELFSNEPVLAKLSYFLMKKRPKHFEMLKQKKIIL